MPAPKDAPCEIRVYVTRELRERFKSAASVRFEPMSTFVRTLLVDALERAERKTQFRSTDPLIYEMAERVKAISEKMGIDLPDSEGENSAEKEG